MDIIHLCVQAAAHLNGAQSPDCCTEVLSLIELVLVIPRKEVIQPHLPIRLPCYDLVPLTGITFGASLLAVGTTTTGAANSGGLTGGVYKAQEQIHRGVADPRLLAIPASCGRIAAHNLN
jgi:hypothetical protein